MLTFSVLIGNSITMDIIGICVGHAYYFLEYIYPVMADIRGWTPKRIMEPPALLHMICGSYQPPAAVAAAVPHDDDEVHQHQD